MRNPWLPGHGGLMGAGNVKLTYGHYAGKVPPLSMLALVFMALTALDRDDPPLFWGGHQSIAVNVLGRRGEFTDSDARAVRRLITPLSTSARSRFTGTPRHAARVRALCATASTFTPT